MPGIIVHDVPASVPMVAHAPATMARPTSARTREIREIMRWRASMAYGARAGRMPIEPFADRIAPADSNTCTAPRVAQRSTRRKSLDQWGCVWAAARRNDAPRRAKLFRGPHASSRR